MKPGKKPDTVEWMILAGCALAVLLLAGCGGSSTKPKDTNGNPPGNVPTYTADVGPLIEAGCTCHQPGGIKYASCPSGHVRARLRPKGPDKATGGR